MRDRPGRQLDVTPIVARGRDYNDAIGSLEGRVLVSARRFRDLGIAGEELPEAQTVQVGARRLNAPEMTGAS